MADVTSLTIHDTVFNIEDSDSDTEVVPAVLKPEKTQLMRELKALGIINSRKPDYTKPLAEPTWGDEEEDDEYEYEEPEDELEVLEYEEIELGGSDSEADASGGEESDVEMK
jgi:hypothetical protein